MLDQYKRIAQGIVGSGDTIILQHSYPQLFFFAKDENIYVLLVREQEYLNDLFNIPLSEKGF
jgi:hypothetical protein